MKETDFFFQARQLIEEGNVIKVIIDTVMEMMQEHLDNNHRFHFQGHNPDKFFRVQVIFHDLRSTHNPWIMENKNNSVYLYQFAQCKVSFQVHSNQQALCVDGDNEGEVPRRFMRLSPLPLLYAGNA